MGPIRVKDKSERKEELRSNERSNENMQDCEVFKERREACKTEVGSFYFFLLMELEDLFVAVVLMVHA